MARAQGTQSLRRNLLNWAAPDILLGCLPAPCIVAAWGCRPQGAAMALPTGATPSQALYCPTHTTASA
eukprot:7476763-Lingulodinium_polyedra.AAC.1